MARLREIPPPAYEPPIEEVEAEAIRQRQIEEAELRAAEKLLDPLGRELCDPTPMEPPIGYNPQPTLVEQMRLMIQGERMRLAAMEMGAESFEEADDFDMDEDPAPASPYEEYFEPTPARELKKRASAANAPPQEPSEPKTGAATSGAPPTEPPPAGPSGAEGARP